jgi:hypothetical protein
MRAMMPKQLKKGFHPKIPYAPNGHFFFLTTKLIGFYLTRPLINSSNFTKPFRMIWINLMNTKIAKVKGGEIQIHFSPK